MFKFLSVLSAALALGLGVMANTAIQTDNGRYAVGNVSVSDEEDSDVVAKGLFAVIKLDLVGDSNGTICATASNTFTLFPSTIPVTVELYYSSTYQTDYTNMTLVSSHSTHDLDMGSSIIAASSTNGEARYWYARAKYRVDDGEWSYLTAGPEYYDANGTFVSY